MRKNGPLQIMIGYGLCNNLLDWLWIRIQLPGSMLAYVLAWLIILCRGIFDMQQHILSINGTSHTIAVSPR
jgi:hypothetical protein